MKLVVLGLTISSSWGNGHATTYRGLLREFAQRGHEVVFLERDVPWYRDQRDLLHQEYCRVEFYQDLPDLKGRLHGEVAQCDFAIVGSYVPEGVAVGDWVVSTAPRTGFYDIDTPVTMAKLRRGDEEYLAERQLADYELYLSFSGGETLQALEALGSPRALALYCSVDPSVHRPVATELLSDLNYLGTYSPDRQPSLENLLLRPAEELEQHRFAVAGPQFPPEVSWPRNVTHIEHLPPAEHSRFYCGSRYTLNVTRKDMIAAGWSPSVRLFEAAACGVPVISDYWRGLDDFFTVGSEILVAQDTTESVRILAEFPEADRVALGAAAQARVLGHHTAAHRAAELEGYLAR